VNSFAAKSRAKKIRAAKIRTSKVDTKYEKKADTNSDGRVSRQENQTARKDYLENRSEVDKKWEEKADKNDDGKVDAKELRKFIHKKNNK
jgi:hypothetical protein